MNADDVTVKALDKLHNLSEADTRNVIARFAEKHAVKIPRTLSGPITTRLHHVAWAIMAADELSKRKMERKAKTERQRALELLRAENELINAAWAHARAGGVRQMRPFREKAEAGARETFGEMVGRQKNPRASIPDDVAVRELYLFVANTGPFYERHTVPVLNLLAKHAARGHYDVAKAVKAFEHLAKKGADAYSRDYSVGHDSASTFNAATRRATAQMLAEHYASDIRDRAMGYVVAKRGPKVTRLGNPRQRTTRDVWDVEGNYGQGWETVTGNYEKRASLANLREYRENEPGTAFRKIRANNPRNVILVLVGHAKGPGYYTGKAWDTVKAKAIMFTTVAGAKAVAKKLNVSIPAGTHIEIHTSGK